MIIPVPQHDNPVLLDKIIQDLQAALKTDLAWLDYAFGRSYRQVNSTGYKYPGVYISNAEYMSVLPNEELGNFCFFEIEDPQEVAHLGTNFLTVKGSIVFWFNLRKIDTDETVILSESVKLEIMNALTKGGILKSGRLTINRIFEQAENVYKGYSLKEVEEQFLMYPFSGFRFECDFKISQTCY